MKRIALLLALAFGLVHFADAAALIGTITGYANVSSAGTPVLIVKLDSGSPVGCNTTGRFALSSTDARYKANLAAVLTAYHTQSRVKISYVETCTSWPNSYDLHFVCVGDVGC